jgi:amino acid transporter
MSAMFLLLKAFSSGCSALTGVEAVSNAIPNFKAPAEKNAAKTLMVMGLILGHYVHRHNASWLTGMALCLTRKQPSYPRSQNLPLAAAVLYFFIQGITAVILFLAANTAYSAFPLLACMFAKDKYMPHAFMVRGDRLGFSNGIIFLGVMSALLVAAFHGNTEGLIPLYAVGVFIPFTLSQLGMMVRWYKLKPAGWQSKFVVNTSRHADDINDYAYLYHH